MISFLLVWLICIIFVCVEICLFPVRIILSHNALIKLGIDLFFILFQFISLSFIYWFFFRFFLLMIFRFLFFNQRNNNGKIKNVQNETHYKCVAASPISRIIKRVHDSSAIFALKNCLFALLYFFFVYEYLQTHIYMCALVSINFFSCSLVLLFFVIIIYW